MKFIIIEEFYKTGFVDIVQKHLDSGWQLHGDPKIETTTSISTNDYGKEYQTHRTVYRQCMTHV